MNVGYLVERAAQHYPRQPAVTCGSVQFTFGQVYDRACRLGNALLGSGCRPGDRVAVYLPNCAEFMEVEFGLALAGLVRVAVNVRLAERDLLYCLEDAGATALIYAGRYAAMATRLLAQTPRVRVVLCRSELQGGPGPGHWDYDDALARASGAPPRPLLTPESLCCLFYTSGTTGRPKGVIHTHKSQAAVAFNLLLEFGPVRPGDKILLLQPLSHGAGFFMLPYFISGAHCVVMEKFEPSAMFETAERLAIETIKLVPTMLIQAMTSRDAARPLLALRRIIYGASPMPAERLREALTLFGPVLAQLYGQAEAPMCITVLPESDHRLDGDRRILSSVGRAWRNVEVRVVDADGRDVEPGESGEVIVRGDHTMQGYWGQPDQTAEVLRDGYVHTRDMATTDDRGYLYLLGRRDEMIISGGLNIAPRGVEEVLHQHPDVLEAAVLGVPDPVWGEAVKAYVVLRPGARAGSDELLDYCKPLLGVQRPRYVEVLPELPKNAYGKIVKAELRAGHKPSGSESSMERASGH